MANFGITANTSCKTTAKLLNFTGSGITDTWSTKSWSGLTNFNGGNVWTDGTNIYFSISSSQYVLDIVTSTWITKIWSGLDALPGNLIWTDGINIYYSYGSLQYVLNVSTSTWSTKTWNGLSNFMGTYIWTDGTNIYYSQSSNQYVLDVSTSTWSTKSWNGLSSFNGSHIWTDGTNIYYSYNSNQYVLDKNSTATYNITTSLTNLTASGDSTIDSDGTSTVTLSANSGYTLPSSITVTNAQYTYDSSTGVISLSNATADVTISASGVKIIISSFNTLSVVDHTEYITLTIGENSINVVKVITPSEWGGTDLTGTTWVFNNLLNNTSIHSTELEFICNEENYLGLDREYDDIIEIDEMSYDRDTIYTNGSWLNSVYKTILITGGTDVTNSNLISWLQNNATLISW